MTLPKAILYADDDTDDKEWVAEACTAVATSLDVVFVGNGRQVLEYLSRKSPDEFPSLIVLDLNMPELDGRQTLKRLKTHPLYQTIPVAIVTTSNNQLDRDVCQQLGAALFLTKPDTHAGWQIIVQRFMSYIS